MTDQEDRGPDRPRRARTQPQGPLVGLKVLDIGQLLAGPMVGTMLADWGADVVKIEQPGVGDPIRQLGTRNGAELWWKANGRGKRSVALDLNAEPDRTDLRSLANSAHILVENFTPGTMERWGLTYSVLSESNPGLIMLRVSGYGQSGPYSHKRGFGRSAQSFSGFSSVNGYAERAPLHPGVPVGDYFAALTGVGAVLAAYIECQGSGLGQEIDLALYEASFRIMELPAITYGQTGLVIGREGTGNTYVAPVGTWQTKDGRWFSLTASTQPVAERLLTLIGGSDLATDPRFLTNGARLQHREELYKILADWIKDHDSDTLAELCDLHEVVYCVEYDMADIFKDQHYAARGTIETVEDPDLGSVGMCTVVPRFARTPGSIRWAGEGIGASQADVMTDPAWRREPLDQDHLPTMSP